MPNPFTPEQIAQILEEFFRVVGTRQYIGARYVPIFGRRDETSIEWDNTAPYEPLTIVLYQGNSYTSRQYVPVGVEITNQEFWAVTGNYNAQVEQYRRDVLSFDGRITANADDITALDTRVTTNETNIATNASDISALDTRVTTNATNIATNANDISEINATLEDMQHVLLTDENIVIFSDSTFQSNPDVSTGVRAKSVVEWLDEICDATIDNRGVGGTSTDWLLNLLNGLSDSAIANATYVIVAYGTNDWQGSKNPYPVANVQTNAFLHVYNSCIEKIKELAPRAQILCVTPAYIHSDKASTDAILNQNRAGSNYKAYCDVIEFVAQNNNCACIRLDNLLTIDESNYRARMIPSSNDIWVHYSEETTREIAYIIANWPHGVNCASSSDYVNVTPAGWNTYTNTSTQAVYQMPTNSFVPSSSTSLSTGTLMSGIPYFLTYMGAGNTKVLVDGVVRNESTEHTIQQFEIMGDGQSHTITFDTFTTPGAWTLVGGLQLTIGRPKITALYNDLRYQRRHTLTGDHSTYRVIEVENMFMLKSNTNLTNVTVANYATPIDTLNGLSGYSGEIIISGQIDGQAAEILGRLDGNGKIYASNTTQIVLTNVRIDGFGLRA